MIEIKNIFASRFTLHASRLRRTACSLQHVAFCFILFLLFPLQGCYSQNQRETAGHGETTAQTETADPYTWDFGQVKEGELLKHDFVLKNESKETLRIKDVNTSCGCTLSKVKEKILLPGQSTAIEVKFNTKGYSGAAKQYVYVHTDSLDKPIIRFIIKADVIKSKSG